MLIKSFFFLKKVFISSPPSLTFHLLHATTTPPPLCKQALPLLARRLRPSHCYQPLTLVANCTTTNYWPLVAIGPTIYPTSTTCLLIIHHQSPMVDHQKFLATVQPLPSSLATSHPSLLPLPSLIMHHNYQNHHYFSPQIATIIRNF